MRVAQVALAGTALVLAAQLGRDTRASGAPPGRCRRARWCSPACSSSGSDQPEAGGGLLLVNGLLVAAGPVLIFDSMRRHLEGRCAP
ncbi:MAG: hypothetical protein R2713_22740 [Ilumatobacteraceae bacterium]